MIGPLSYLDVALIAVALLSALLAMYRGFTREILSILSWIAAAGAVLYFVLFQKRFAEDVAQQIGTQTQIAQIGIGAILFLIVLVFVHLITSRVSDSILDSRVGMIDRILGFLFGMARGLVLVVIPFMFYENFFPDPKQQYPWVREAKTLPVIRATGDAFKSVLLRYVPQNVTVPQGTEQQG